MLYGDVPPLVLGLTGSFGSGCSTLSALLSDRLGFVSFSMSGPIRQEWANTNPGQDESVALRHQLQTLGNEGRSESGNSFWAKGIAEQIPPNAPRIVVDGIRNMGEVDFFRETYPNFYLIAVLCSREERWERVRQQYIAREQTEEDFITDDEREQIEELDFGQQVESCVDAADLVINNQTHQPSSGAAQAALADPIKMYVGLLEGTDPIAPSTDEIAMTIAYAQSRRSFCLKRHVAAVVTDKHGDIVSTGFNENPSTMAPCYIEFRYCYKDSMMTQELSRMKCPKCSSQLPELHDPYRCPACNEDLKLRFFPDRGMRWCTALHAEERALLNAQGADIAGGYLYTTTFPCFNCARVIAQAGLKRVIYVSPYPQLDVLPFLERNGVEAQPFQGVKARAFERVFSPVRAAMEKQYSLRSGGDS